MGVSVLRDGVGVGVSVLHYEGGVSVFCSRK